MNSDNSKKAQSGSNQRKELSALIADLKKQFNSVTFKKKNYRKYIAYGALHKLSTQFSVNEEVEFNDEHPEIWLIKTSSSLRSDRIKGDEFDIEHIKSILKLANNQVDIKAYFVVQDNPSDKDLTQFKNYKEKVLDKKIVTFFDDILTFSEFQNLLQSRCSKYLSQGIQSNILGSNSEKEISDAFNNPNNVILWNNPSNSIIKSRNFSIVKALLEKIAPNFNIVQLEAFNNDKKDKAHYLEELNIVRDSQGKGNLGKPKTDVLIHVLPQNNEVLNINLSIKHPKNRKKGITVHEGNVESLISDLSTSLPETSKFNDETLFNKLKLALLNFQKAGSAKGMDQDLREFLEENLQELNEWLIDYFVFGINNSRFNENQKANMIAMVNPDNGAVTFNTREEEIHMLLADKKRAFGTPFSWTYPSKKRGQKIQIKLPPSSNK